MNNSFIISLILFVFSANLFGQNISLDLFVDGLNNPVGLKHAGDGRMFVVEKIGKIKVINTSGTVNGVPFLDVSSLISLQNEQGLLGLAFHPDYDSNGYFYINYTNIDGDTQIDRYTVSASPNIADPNSGVNILTIPQPSSIHNGGCINFGPDGYLYIATGDGLGGGDPENNAQDTSSLLGKILRIDVDDPSGGNNYGIPSDNPFEGSSSEAEEIWAYGLRNPWKFSFDSETGDLWVGDVGNVAFEEINRIEEDEAGANFGWRCYEAYTVFNNTNCPPASQLTFPVYAYSHVKNNCNAVTGGYVYRGNQYPNMQGIYFFADYCRGFIWSLNENLEFRDFGNYPELFSAFGTDVNGELYVVSKNGPIYHINGDNLGVNENNFNTTVFMVPNPASDTVQIKSSEVIVSILIFDITGKMIHSPNVSNNKHEIIDLSALNSGFYIVKTELDNGATMIKKLLIE